MSQELKAAKNFLQGMLLGCASICFIAASLVLLFLYLSFQEGTAKSLGWPQTTCQIKQSRMNETPNDYGVHTAIITYSYKVAGKSYTGERVRFQWPSIFGFAPLEITQQDGATSLIDQFKPSTSVPISYDPKKPQISVLIPGFPPLPTRFQAICISLAVVGMLCFIFAIYKYNQHLRVKKLVLKEIQKNL